MVRFLSTSLCVELFMCIFSYNLQKKMKKMVLLSPPHGWEYCHHIFFLYFIPILSVNISPMESAIMTWEGTQVLLEVKLNPDTIPLSLNLSSNAKMLPFVYNCLAYCWFIEASESAHRWGHRGYLGSPSAADAERYKACLGAVGVTSGSLLRCWESSSFPLLCQATQRGLRLKGDPDRSTKEDERGSRGRDNGWVNVQK